MEEIIDIGQVWQDYGLDQLSHKLDTLFPDYKISLEELFSQILTGDITGALAGFLESVIHGLSMEFTGMKNILVWLLVLGIVSALLSYFIEIFDKHQIADLGFYIMYLLVITILLKCFEQAADLTVTAIDQIVLFIQLLIPTYLLSVGLATGSTTVGAYYQLLLLVIYGVEHILASGLIPFIYSYCMLCVVNGVWMDGKLALLTELVEKGIKAALKASVGIITGISIFQSVITPIIDSVKSSALQKAVSAIPGIGNAADGVVELVTGSAVVIKNALGIIILILLLVLCAVPLLRILIIACLIKLAAALVGIVGDKRLTACMNQVGEGSLLLLRTAGTAMLLFLITVSVLTTASNRGF